MLYPLFHTEPAVVDSLLVASAPTKTSPKNVEPVPVLPKKVCVPPHITKPTLGYTLGLIGGQRTFQDLSADQKVVFSLNDAPGWADIQVQEATLPDGTTENSQFLSVTAPKVQTNYTLSLVATNACGAKDTRQIGISIESK